MPTIGPTFGREIIAAGLKGLPFGWTADGVTGRDALTPEQDAALQAVIDTHDPTAKLPRVLDRKAFLLKLDALGKYADFLTWKASQPVATQIHFDEDPHFSEDDEVVEDAATALSITVGGIFSPGT